MNNKKYKYWSVQEDEFLRQNYEKMTTRELGGAIGRTKQAVMNRLKKLGIRLSIEEKERRLKDNIFKVGQTPWNKGIHCRFSPATEFKKGQKPKNIKSIGSVSVRTKIMPDGKEQKYLFVKVSENKWVLLHRLLWEQNYGKIPDGFVVRFKDGDSMNCVLENLELISRKENRNRNCKEHPGTVLTDNFIAARSFGLRGRYNREKFAFIQQNRDLIELKRKQLLLQRLTRKEL